jgi:phage repressor protein C with HTH and peptisase S24 domain
MRFPLSLYRVSGRSMTPTFQPGDVVLGLRWFRPRLGMVVIAHGPEQILIKRIARLDAGSVWLEGDNQAISTDSRSFGALSRGQLEARVMVRLGRLR